MRRGEALIRVEKLTKHFQISRGILGRRQAAVIHAVDDVSLAIREGETLGLVGESGSGKTTLGRTILQLELSTSGKTFYRDIDLGSLKGVELRRIRRHMQIVFQDPYSSLNPRLNVGKIIADPMEVHSISGSRARLEKVRELIELVRLGPDSVDRFPHEFSGGQRQRIAIARALALDPDFLVLDEPISALDVSIQAQIVNLLEGLQDHLQLTYLFIAHDLSMVRHIADRVAVMYLGKVVELAHRDELFAHPSHPYAHALLSAVPIANPRRERARTRIILPGDVPSPANPPGGCRFHPRCPQVRDDCRLQEPEWREVEPDHWTACFFPFM